MGVVVLKYMYTVNCYYCMQLVMSDGHNLVDWTVLGGTELVARGVSVGVRRFCPFLPNCCGCRAVTARKLL